MKTVPKSKAIVLLTDFGTQDRFVASMKGVIFGIDPEISIFDLTHEIPPYSIADAAGILAGTIPFWPEGTTFVSVVDPGVGTPRRSVVCLTRNNHYIITPDNGTLTEVLYEPGIKEAKELLPEMHRRPGSELYHTFDGRDLYAYAAARLASGRLNFEELPVVPEKDLVLLDNFYLQVEPGKITGTITRIEQPYGNLCTNIPASTLREQLKFSETGSLLLKIGILHKNQLIFEQSLPFLPSFGFTGQGKPLIYQDSVGKVGLAVSMGNFARHFQIEAGQDWIIILQLPLHQ
jgi:S-adenosylmethionine hydrolase